MSLMVGLYDLPEAASVDTAYRLLPKQSDAAYYHERTDRNIGWITPEEQISLSKSVVGIAGCGGMGGLIASTFVRLGIGQVRIADCEVFDVSNINRQFGAMRTTVGLSKAFETARLIRTISNDNTLVVYPQGITEETVDSFLAGCDVVCDEIEVFALDARILLHQRARARGISLFNCNTVGLSTNLFLYTPESMTMEEATGISYDEAKEMCAQARNGDRAQARHIGEAMVRAVLPKVPVYSRHPGADREAFFGRLYAGKAPILATNPSLASGFLADRVLLYLLRNSGVRRTVVQTPEMPGYLRLDAWHMQMETVSTGEWLDEPR